MKKIFPFFLFFLIACGGKESGGSASLSSSASCNLPFPITFLENGSQLTYRVDDPVLSSEVEMSISKYAEEAGYSLIEVDVGSDRYYYEVPNSCREDLKLLPTEHVLNEETDSDRQDFLKIVARYLLYPGVKGAIKGEWYFYDSGYATDGMEWCEENFVEGAFDLYQLYTSSGYSFSCSKYSSSTEGEILVNSLELSKCEMDAEFQDCTELTSRYDNILLLEAVKDEFGTISSIKLVGWNGI